MDNKIIEFNLVRTKQPPINKSSRINQPKSQLDYVKLIKGIKLQQDLRKVKQFRALQQSIKRDKQQVSEIEIQLQRVEKQIIFKKQQIIRKQIEKIEHHKKQREEFIRFTNQQLNKVKLLQQRKDINMQLSLKQQEEKKKESYSKTLKQRINRYRNPINFEQIKHHQKKYLQMRQSFINQSERHNSPPQQIKRSLRVRSQAESRHENQFQNLSIDPKSMLNQRIKQQYDEIKNKSQKKREQLVKMMQKRNQYGNRVEIEMKNNKVKTQPNENYHQRAKLHSISSLKQSTPIQKKPHLDTNLPKMSLNDRISMSLRKIQQSKMINTMQKIQKLKTIENIYNNKKNFQSDDLLTQLTLIKADLLLHI